MTSREERLGLLFAGLCAANGACFPVVAKLITGRAAPLFVAASSDLLAGGAAALLLAARGDLAVLWDRRVGPHLLLIAALGTAAAHLLFYLGSTRTTAIEAILCLQIEPAYSLLLAWAVLGHRPTRGRVAAIAVLLAGLALAVGGAGVHASSGIWLLLATPLCWQLSHLVVLRQLVGVPAVILTSARYLHGGLLLAAAWVMVDGAHSGLSGPDLPALLPLLAVQGCVLGYAGTLFWYSAIARIDLARATAIVVPAIPLLGFAASFFVLGEVASARQWVGVLLTAVGILAFVTSSRGTREERATSDEQ